MNDPNKNPLPRLDNPFSLKVDDGFTSDPPSFPLAIKPPSSSSIPVRPDMSNLKNAKPNISFRPRDGSGKLLSHVLIQLFNRDKPGSLVDAVYSSHKTKEGDSGVMRNTLVRLGVRQEFETPSGKSQDDLDEEGKGVFTTDTTIDFMLQLTEVLKVSVQQGLQIFEEIPLWTDTMVEKDLKLSSPFRRSRISKTSGKRSRSPSPLTGQVQFPENLTLFVSILNSIVSEDCRYKVASPRPTRPPNALQVLTLHIAQFLVHVHFNQPRVVSQIAFAMIPALYTFPSQMHARLLSFFESSIVRVALEKLAELQGRTIQDSVEKTSQDHVKSFQESSPIVSITIDEVQPQNDLHQAWFLSNSSSINNHIQSTNNARQPLDIYHLAFLIPPLLAAMLDSFGDASGLIVDTVLSTQFTGFLRLVANLKPDAYNDLLEIIAYHSPKSRRMAISCLALLWPASVGHAVMSLPFSLLENHNTQLIKDSCAHQFMPWFFDHCRDPSPTYTELHDSCRSCSKVMQDFSLLCPFCLIGVHFECYDHPEGNCQIQYSLDVGSQKRIAMSRISVLQQIDESVIEYGHKFRKVNSFTLLLCFVCHEPLWGCLSQGLNCRECSVSIHERCLPSLSSFRQCGTIITSKDMTIDWAALRQSCLDYYPFLQSQHPHNHYSFEEIAILYSVLQVELQILNNGVALGTIIVTQKGKESTVDEVEDFELQQVMRDFELLLGSAKLRMSPSTQYFMQDPSSCSSKRLIIFNLVYLQYMTATLKTSSPDNHKYPLSNPELLNVHPLNLAFALPEPILHESISLWNLQDILAQQFSVHSDHAAKFILKQLYHLAFFATEDRRILSFEEIFSKKEVSCTFPLPLGLDLSTNVEILVSSVEASLVDLDLSTNEFAFILLTRRLWPTKLASEHGLKRLATKILSWMLNEDHDLGIVLREFLAKQKKLPGVRSGNNLIIWPPTPDLRPCQGATSSNGGDYVSARRSILVRYALPWLYELHSLDSELYCQTLFNTCLQMASDRQPTNMLMSNKIIEKKPFKFNDDLLYFIIKLCQHSVVFSVFDSLFIQWMEIVVKSNEVGKPIPSLYRLLTEGFDTVQQYTFTDQPINPPSQSFQPDPLETITNLASRYPTRLSQSLSYLTFMVISGVNIPLTTFNVFSSLLLPSSPDLLENTNTLVSAVALHLWQWSSGKESFQSLIATLLTAITSRMIESLETGKNTLISFCIIRLSLAACLRIYGCKRSGIIAAGLIMMEEVQRLPLRSKLSRNSAVTDPIIIHPEILAALQLYMQSDVEDIHCLVSKFLNMFIMESPYMEAFEVDNFILRNGKLTGTCVWTSYNIQREDLAIVRTNLLLRSLAIDPDHLQNSIRTHMDPLSSPIEHRLSAVSRLFQMILDVTSPAFDVEGRQWRSNVSEVFVAFFFALWGDPSEEIRSSARSYSASLLPAHFENISQCWNEALLRAPISERSRLVGFLTQLRPHFPGWKVINWESIIEALEDYDISPKTFQFRKSEGDEKEMVNYPQNADPDLIQLRVSLITLSLGMLCDGIEIDYLYLMKLKVQFVRSVGFRHVSLSPSQNWQFYIQFSELEEILDSAYPCIEELAHIVDSSHYIKVPQSILGIIDDGEDKIVNVLVGSIFLDAVVYILSTIRTYSSVPVPILKCLLETLYIAIHKFDFKNDLFRHLQLPLITAMQQTIELVSSDVSYELRQLALSIAQAAVNNCHFFLGSVISTIIEIVAKEIASQGQNSQDSLVVHGKSLIANALQKYVESIYHPPFTRGSNQLHSFSSNGLLFNLIKRNLQTNFFNVLSDVFFPQGKNEDILPNAICDALLRDLLTRAIDCEPALFMLVLRNISHFIEIVYFQNYSADLIIWTGQQLANIVRRMSDGTIQGADPSPLIQIFVVLIRNNGSYLKDLSPSVDTVLRVALNRLVVDISCLTLLISATATLPRSESGTIDIISILFETLFDSFRMKTKMLPLTMKALIESLASIEQPWKVPSLIGSLVDDAFFFLQNHIWHEEDVNSNFQAAFATGKLLFKATSIDPTVFVKFTDPPLEKYNKFSSAICSWNILLIVAMQEDQSDWKLTIFAYFLKFSATYATLLRSYVTYGIAVSSSATTDVNQTYIAIKLWLMLAHSIDTTTDFDNGGVVGVWNELWPAYEAFLHTLETEAQLGLNPTFISFVTTSAADLLFYLKSLKISLALDTSSHLAIFNRLLLLSRGESQTAKVVRAIKSITEPPTEIVTSILLDQIVKEFIAAEKIRTVDSKREHGRLAGEKRKEVKFPG